MTPKKFLLIGGVILIIVAVVGFLIPRIGGDYLWFDAAENWAHLVLGVVAVLIAKYAPVNSHKPIAAVVGVVALYFAIAGFLVAGRSTPNWYGVAHLENPLDNLVHLVIGIWALWASFGKGKA